jgi:hypothetical protein
MGVSRRRRLGGLGRERAREERRQLAECGIDVFGNPIGLDVRGPIGRGQAIRHSEIWTSPDLVWPRPRGGRVHGMCISAWPESYAFNILARCITSSTEEIIVGMCLPRSAQRRRLNEPSIRRVGDSPGGCTPM